MQKIADLLVENKVVRVNFQTPFEWSSGILSPIYCDCRELISLPSAREEIVEALCNVIEKNNLPTDLIAGTATAGIAWSSFVAGKLGCPLAYVRTKAKSHGGGKRVEGRAKAGQNALVLEDALSTGGSSIQSADALRTEWGANVENILAIFSWSTPALAQNAKNAQIKLWTLTDFEEIADSLRRNEIISDSELEKLHEFHQNPTEWNL